VITPIIQIQRRSDTAANWTSNNPVLSEGEMGVENDTGFHKIGDGVTAWTSLIYWHGPPWMQFIDGGTPTSTFGGAPSAPNHGIMSYAKVVNPIDMSGESPSWREMHAMGRHASDPTKIVFIGIETFGEAPSIGILNRNTGLIETTHSEALAGTGATTFTDIDCDTATGVYVAQSDTSQSGQHGSNSYIAYWSTDLTTWTACLETGWNSRFHSGRLLKFDPGNGLWWRGDLVGGFTSDDGKEFYEQGMDYGDFGNLRMAQYWAMMHQGRLTDAPNASFFSGNTERPIRCIPTGATAPLNFNDVIALFNIVVADDGLILGSNPAFNGGCDIDFAGDNIVMAVNGGIMIHSESGAPGTWAIAAANQVGSTSNEWIDGTIPAGGMLEGGFCFCEGEWWAPRGTGGSGNWYRYSNAGLPIGYGWTQDNTGPFKVRSVHGNPSRYMRDPYSCRFAYMGYDAVNESSFIQRIWYDKGDL
jgi:hypothetical protein